MAEEKPAQKHKGQWRLFVFPAILAAVGAYFALTRAPPNAAQRAAMHAAPHEQTAGSAQPRP
jgi:hypothetical protein